MDDYPPCASGCAECESTLRIRDDEIYNTPNSTPYSAEEECVECTTFRDMVRDSGFGGTTVSAAAAEEVDAASPANLDLLENVDVDGVDDSESSTDADPDPDAILAIVQNYADTPHENDSESNDSAEADPDDAILALIQDYADNDSETNDSENDSAEAAPPDEGDLATALLILPRHPLLLDLASLLARSARQQRDAAAAAARLEAAHAASDEFLRASIWTAGSRERGGWFPCRGILYWGDDDGDGELTAR